MAIRRRFLRFALILFVVGLGATVLLGLRERAAPAAGLVVQRSDPNAVIQTRTSRIVQTDAAGDNFNLVAGRQLTYPDGDVRLLDGVEVTVGARDDREAFDLQSAEATVDGDKTEVRLDGGVRFATGGGLEAHTEQVFYTDADGIVRMPGAASFERDGMRASARQAVYDRARDFLRLWGDALVALPASGRTTDISAAAALIAQTDGYMTFDGGVAVDADRLQMTASRAWVEIAGEPIALEVLQLQENARILGRRRVPGQLRAMSASDIRLGYAEEGRRLERATMIGDARLGLFGSDGDQGTEIDAQSMDVGFTSGGDGVSALEARTGVVVDMPRGRSGPDQRIGADALHGASTSGHSLDHARFEGNVEYSERGGGGSRSGRADRLEATFATGLAALEDATFRGGVTFEDGAVRAFGDEARYLIADDAIELLRVAPSGRLPRVVDRRGSMQAGRIRLAFDGPRIAAQDDVESVLSETAVAGGAQRPGLLDSARPVLVIAGELLYDGRAQTAAYGGGARLWQGETQFRGDTIVLDEAVGDLRIDGAAWTRFPVTQIDDATGLPEESLSTGRGGAMRYERAEHRVTYTAAAGLDGPQGDLTADTIQVHLHADDNTLDRVTAAGDVMLTSPGRRVSGDTLVYHDADGRYEMEGQPVRMVEEEDGECRETTGRTLTFFIAADDVSVDGQAEIRTATASGKCPELLRK